MLSTLSCLGTRWFPPSDHFEIHDDGPESEHQGASVCGVFLFFCHFPIRCSGSGVILFVPSSLLFILSRVPTHRKYPTMCYPLRSNCGRLPIRCAYFILECIVHTQNFGVAMETCLSSIRFSSNNQHLLTHTLSFRNIWVSQNPVGGRVSIIGAWTICRKNAANPFGKLY